MRKLTILLLALFFSGILFAQNPIKVTLYGDDNYAPYSYLENGKPAGIYYEILKKASTKMQGYEIEFKASPWKRCLNELKEGKYFAIYPPYYRPKERPYMNPYSEPILAEQVVVYTNKKIKVDENSSWPEDFYGMKVGLNAGFSFALGGEKFQAAIKRGDITIEQIGGNETNIKKLNAGRIDAYLNDNNAIQWTIKKVAKDGISKKSFNKGPVTSSENGYLAYTISASQFPFKDDFVKKLDKVIKDMKASGEIKNIIDAYLK